MLYSRFVRAFRCFAVAVLCIALLSFSFVLSHAADSGSLTLTVTDPETGTAVGGMVFRLYTVASAELKNGGYEYTYLDGYEDCGMDTSGLWDPHAPTHLAAHAGSKGLPYTQHNVDDSGTVIIGDLALGVYLVLPIDNAEGYITPAPFVVTIPMWDAAANKWQLDINASPKLEVEVDDEDSFISVKKVWIGGYDHPAEVKVALLKDSVVVDTVTLNAQNGWHHRFDALESGHSWSVAELSVPKGYTVDYVSSETTLTIVNSTDEEEPPVDDTEGKEPPKDQLIQTGQLNWPVPVLSAIGLLLFATGWALCNFGARDEDA